MAAPLLLSTIISALVVVASSTRGTMANGVFQVRRKFHIVDGVYKGSDIGALQTHDGNRHRRRNLMAAELPLGGFSIPYGTGLYYTDIGIGTPAVKYYVQVDTGSEAFWVNGISCKQCPHESDILRKLTFYDPRSSVSSKEVKCDDTICTSRPPCNMTLRCPYIAAYSDGGLTMGILFTDLLHYHQLYGNGQTQPTSTSVTFGARVSLESRSLSPLPYPQSPDPRRRNPLNRPHPRSVLSPFPPSPPSLPSSPALPIPFSSMPHRLPIVAAAPSPLLACIHHTASLPSRDGVASSPPSQPD
uniref:Peptidase A1 domain-containing protein n=1 Tax=Oryza glumipatula TaxID=40148 RepID=A0A0D9ZJ07_9ORYZ